MPNHYGYRLAAELAEAFIASKPGGVVDGMPVLHIWRHYPQITPAQDEYTDRWACEQVTETFCAFVLARAPESLVRVVFANQADNPDADYHVWARIGIPGGTFDVDFTARQYHNLLDPLMDREKLLAAPWPMIWVPKGGADADRRSTAHHPVVGRFSNVVLHARLKPLKP